MKNIYCIVGPSGSGKTTLANALADKYGYKVIESYTTRPTRYEGEKGHIFVSPEEFKSLGDKYAYNVYDGYEYGITSNLIKENDLYVVEPSGVEDLLKRYRGEKGIKVLALAPGPEVLIERMHNRGDSDEKIVRRLGVDAETFQNLDSISDVTWNSERVLDDLCEAVHSHIELFEDRARHEFSLLNEYGNWVATKSCDSMEDALNGIKKAYPDGLPEGWTVRDDTALLREKYIKAIKKQNPKYKTSQIYIDPSENNFNHEGYTVVPFKYGDKRYSYLESPTGDTWIQEVFRTRSERSAVDILSGKINFLYKQMERVDKELKKEYEDGETDWAAQLEVSRERLESAVCYLEKALDYAKKISVKPALDMVIGKAKSKEKSKIVVDGLVAVPKNETVL